MKLDPNTLAHLVTELERMEALQHEKVVDLARRLLPHVTADDIKNPHDFPELEDPDWHYADGQLAGLQSALFLVRSLAKAQNP